MSITNFIPQIWHGAMLSQLTHGAVLAALANRSYEGLVKAGNQVHFTGTTPISVKDYKTAGRVTTPEEVSDEGFDLNIDFEKAFDFLVDDIDRRQAAGSLDNYTESAAIGLLEDTEATLATTLLGGDTAPYSVAAPGSFKAAWDVLLELRERLSDAKAPMSDRICVVNASFERALLDAEGTLAKVDTSGDNKGLREATIGSLAGFRIVVNNYLDNTKPTAIGYHAPTLVLANQIDKLEALRAEKKFADRIRGLHVYGTGLVRPGLVKVYKAV